MIRSSLQLLARRSLAHIQLLSAVVTGVALAATILAGAVVYTDSLKDLAVQHALAPSDTSEVDLLITSTFGPLSSEARDTVFAAVDDRVRPAIEGHGEARGFAVRSGTFLLPSDVAFGTGQAAPNPADSRRLWIGGASPFGERISYLSGRPPAPFGAGQSLDDPLEPITIEAAISTADVALLNARVGSVFDIFPGWVSERERVSVEITGVFERLVADDDFWRLYDEGLQDRASQRQTVGLLVDEPALLALSETALPKMDGKFAWLYDIDTAGLTPGAGREMVSRLAGVERAMSGTLDDYRQITELPDVIGGVTASVTLNTVPMNVVLVLVMIVVLYYVAVLGTLLVDAQRTEIGLLASRGATQVQVLIVYAIEAFALAVLAAVAAPFIAMAVVALIGLLPWFSDLNDGAALPVRLSARAFQASALGGVLIVLALAVPALKASRLGVVNQLRMLARPPVVNFVQRYYLDLVFLGMVVYLFWQLSHQGSFLADRLFGEDKVDQLILAVPAMAMVAIAIVVVRLFPLATTLLAKAVTSRRAYRVVPTTMVLGLWEMARNPAHHARFSLLLMLTAGLGVFAASFGATLQQSFTDRVNYETGADVRLTNVRPQFGGQSVSIAAEAGRLDGVQASSAAFRTLGSVLNVREANQFSFLAVDAETIRDVAWERSDFATSRDPGLLALIDGGREAELLLPADASRLSLRLRTARESSGVLAISARAQDVNDRFFTLQLGLLAQPGQISEGGRFDFGRDQICEPDGERWCDLSASLRSVPLDDGGSFEPAAPVRIHSLGISRTPRFPFGGTIQAAGLDFDSLSVEDATGAVTVIEDFDDPQAWHPLRTSPGSRGDVIRVAEDGGAETPGVARFVWTRSQANEFRGIGFGPQPGPAPVLVSETLLEEFRIEVGDRLTVSFGAVPIDIVIVDTVDYFPTLDPEVRPFVVAELDDIISRTNVVQVGTEVHPDEVWISSSAGAAEIGGALPVRFYQSVQRSQLLGRVDVDPLLSAGWRALLAVSFFTVLTVSAIGFLVHSRVTFQSRARDFALLRTVGLSMPQLLGLVVLEHLLVIGVAVVVGVFAGARLGETIMPYLANSGGGVEVTPPMVLQIDWGNFAAAFGLLGVVLAAVIGAIAVAVYRMSIHSAMRLGD